jgi:hypothetical protein
MNQTTLPEIIDFDNLEPLGEEVNLSELTEGREDMPRLDNREARRGGYYWLEGKPYPSVTRMLEVLDKPALRYWFGREVFRAMAANPGLSEKEALNAPYQLSDSAKARGSTVHSIVEAYRHSKTYIEGVPEPYRGYAQAFYRWTEDNHVEILEHERTVVSRKHAYAGTLDLLCTLNGTGKPVLIDVKTGKDIYPEAFLQLSAYRQALKEEGTEVSAIGVLLLQEDGAYKYQCGDFDCFRQFFACKVLWEWLHAEEYEKMKAYARKGKK